MKNEDFNKLKAICEKEGFDIELSSPWDQTYRVSKKDPWEGVEFVECITNFHSYTDPKKGKIYKVSKIPDGLDYIEVVNFVGGMHKDIFKPSTEQAYIEQLKKTAYEKFGEIKEGDRFDSEKASFCWSNNIEIKKENSLNEWWYDKEFDRLLYYSVLLYQQGKWATKLPERVKVEFHDWEYRNSNTANVSLIFHIPKWSEVQDKDDIGEHLAKQLENYLNNEKQD